jgi:hypothetical protein
VIKLFNPVQVGAFIAMLLSVPVILPGPQLKADELQETKPVLWRAATHSSPETVHSSVNRQYLPWMLQQATFPKDMFFAPRPKSLAGTVAFTVS